MDKVNESKCDRKFLRGLRTSVLKSKTKEIQKAAAAPPTTQAVLDPLAIVRTVSAVQAPEERPTADVVTVSSSTEISRSMPISVPPVALVDLSGDNERTEKRYREAVEELKKSVKLPRKNWEAFDVPDFNNLTYVTNPILQLQEDIKKTLEARQASFQDKSFWAMRRRQAEKVFTAISPLTKNVLSVAKEGSNVFLFKVVTHADEDIYIKSVWLVIWWASTFDYGMLHWTSFNHLDCRS